MTAVFEDRAVDALPAQGEVRVDLRKLSKEYHPLPRWMRAFTKSATDRVIHALVDVDLQVHAGTICAVVGPNGAGKSTLFRVLMGLTTPTSGEALVLGHDAAECSLELRRSLGFMASDDRSLLLRLSCRENLRFHAGMRGYTGDRLDARVTEVLDEVGLGPAADRAAFALSAGMRARLQVARAMLHRPAVLILDEPTATLDPVAAYDLLELVRAVTTEHRLAVLLSSHRLEEIDALDDTVLLLDGGRRVFHGALAELRARNQSTELILEFDTPESAAAASAVLQGSAEVERVALKERSVEVAALATPGAVLAALGGLTAGLLHVRERSGATRELLRQVYAAAKEYGDARS